MARTGLAAPRRGGKALIPPAVTLALWRLRRTWHLLLAAELGVLAGVMLICTVPLFTQVAQSVGLRAALSGTPSNAPEFISGPGVVPIMPRADEIYIQAFSDQPSITMTQQAQQALDPIMRRQLGPFYAGGAVFSVMSQALPLVPDPGATDAQGSNQQIALQGVGTGYFARDYSVVAGRAPVASNTTLEIALTQPDANSLGAKPGTVL